jgi:serpin B
MERVLAAGFVQRDGFTILSLPYVTGDLQILVLLPDEVNGVDQLPGKLTPRILQDCTKLRVKDVKLFLPRFRIEGTTFPLGKTLRAMGMTSAFDNPKGTANFDRAAPRKPEDYLAISEVFHQAFVAVDEQGTEASAATAMTMVTLALATMPPPTPPEVHVDRPFLFAIQHRASGACLFLGRISDPR